MKKFIYLMGLFTAMIMSIGYIMSMLRFPLGRELAITGALGFSFLFMPMLFASEYTKTLGKPRPERTRFVSGFISAGLLGLSVIMKQVHIVGADIVLVAGGGFFTLVFLPALFLTLYKKSMQAN